jgi:hypothetical protein
MMATVEELRGDDDYALRWPADLFAEELERLISRATPPDQAWVEDVELLLSQAFASAAPLEEFRRLVSSPPPNALG